MAIELPEQRQEKNILIDWRAFFDEEGAFYNEDARTLFNRLCSAYYVSVLFEQYNCIERNPTLRGAIETNINKNSFASEESSSLLTEIHNGPEYASYLKTFAPQQKPTLFIYTPASPSHQFIQQMTAPHEEATTLYAYQFPLYPPSHYNGWKYSTHPQAHRALHNVFFPPPPIAPPPKKECLSVSDSITYEILAVGSSLMLTGFVLMMVGIGIGVPPLLFIGGGIMLGGALLLGILCLYLILSTNPHQAPAPNTPSIEAPAVEAFMLAKPTPF